jgi:hypothetical protein
MTLQTASISDIKSTRNSYTDTFEGAFDNERKKACKDAASQVLKEDSDFVSKGEQSFLEHFIKEPFYTRIGHTIEHVFVHPSEKSKSESCAKVYRILTEASAAAAQKEAVLDVLNKNPNLSAEDRALIDKAYQRPLLLRDTSFLADLQGIRARLEAKAQANGARPPSPVDDCNNPALQKALEETQRKEEEANRESELRNKAIPYLQNNRAYLSKDGREMLESAEAKLNSNKESNLTQSLGSEKAAKLLDAYRGLLIEDAYIETAKEDLKELAGSQKLYLFPNEQDVVSKFLANTELLRDKNNQRIISEIVYGSGWQNYGTLSIGYARAKLEELEKYKDQLNQNEVDLLAQAKQTPTLLRTGDFRSALSAAEARLGQIENIKLEKSFSYVEHYYNREEFLERLYSYPDFSNPEDAYDRIFTPQVKAMIVQVKGNPSEAKKFESQIFAIEGEIYNLFTQAREESNRPQFRLVKRDNCK